MPPTSSTVLIVTGGYLAGGDDSVRFTLWKQLVQSRGARHAWLEAKVKAIVAEPVVRAHWRRPTTAATPMWCR
jgi:hypothetical protein